METLEKVWDLIWNVGDPVKWNALIAHIGVWPVYGVLFLIVFAETGLVVFPWLPGDLLLFGIGMIIAQTAGTEGGPVMSPITVGVILMLGAFCGDNVNFWLGKKIGPAVFRGEKGKFFSRSHLDASHRFYAKHGGKAIIISRFIAYVRTFSPFVAGMSRMDYRLFLFYSVLGSFIWVVVCMGAGYMLGHVQVVKDYFEPVVITIVLGSLGLMILGAVRHHLKTKREAAQQGLEVVQPKPDAVAPQANDSTPA
jgi:membrane-associated protein